MIIIEKLTKRYGSQVVLENFNATLETGRLTCILGPSGIGKTTLVRILMGLETADSGTVSGLDALVKSAVFQEDRLCSGLDVYTNILLPHLQKPSPLTLAQIDQGLSALDLQDQAHKLAGALSGGMKRRAALLRALFAPYDILFLDEPFKGLDAQTKEKSMAYLKANTQGKTVICITHDQNEVTYLNPVNTLYL